MPVILELQFFTTFIVFMSLKFMSFRISVFRMLFSVLIMIVLIICIVSVFVHYGTSLQTM
jgi:hypothetical protein